MMTKVANGHIREINAVQTSVSTFDVELTVQITDLNSEELRALERSRDDVDKVTVLIDRRTP